MDHRRPVPMGSLHHVSSPEDLQRGTPRLDLVETGLTAKAQDWSVDFMVMGRKDTIPQAPPRDSGLW